MTKKAIFTLESRRALDFLDGDDKFPFTFDCFYVTNAHYDYGDLDIRKLPDDLNPINEPAVKEDIDALSGITLRSRFNPQCEGPFIINIPDDYHHLNRDDVEAIVRNWYSDGTLKEKLRQAKV